MSLPSPSPAVTAAPALGFRLGEVLVGTAGTGAIQAFAETGLTLHAGDPDRTWTMGWSEALTAFPDRLPPGTALDIEGFAVTYTGPGTAPDTVSVLVEPAPGSEMAGDVALSDFVIVFRRLLAPEWQEAAEEEPSLDLASLWADAAGGQKQAFSGEGPTLGMAVRVPLPDGDPSAVDPRSWRLLGASAEGALVGLVNQAPTAPISVSTILWSVLLPLNRERLSAEERVTHRVPAAALPVSRALHWGDPQRERLPDGTTLIGVADDRFLAGSGHFADDGRFVPDPNQGEVGEWLVIDRRRDLHLARLIELARAVGDGVRRDQLRGAFRAGGAVQQWRHLLEGLHELVCEQLPVSLATPGQPALPDDQPVFLGLVPVLGCGRPAHRAVLLHVLADAAGCKAPLVLRRGRRGETSHWWNEVTLAGQLWLLDPDEPGWLDPATTAGRYRSALGKPLYGAKHVWL